MDDRVETITASQIASLVEKSRSSVVRRSGIDKYILGRSDNPSGVGAPVKLFNIKVLELFNYTPTQIEEIKMKRKTRSDKNTARKKGITPEMEKIFIETALAEYLSQGAREDIQDACWRTARTLFDAAWQNTFKNHDDMSRYFYFKRIMRRDIYYIGYAHRHPTWQTIWERRWKKSDFALKNTPTMRYNWLDIGISAGVLGKGLGAATIFWLDDHTSDSFVYDESKKQFKGQLPKGLYCIDGWTGMPLGFEPGEVTAFSTAILILKCCLKFGLPYAIGLENSRAMKSLKVERLIEALYPDDLLKSYQKNTNSWFNILFEGFSSPIVRNIPNIPRFVFKARLEAWFKNIKAHDALYYPRHYHAGGLDPVQLQLNTMPATINPESTIQKYFQSLNLYLSDDFLTKPRPGMFPGFQKESGLIPTINNVWEYFGGNNNAGTHRQPDISKIAYMLYWLTQFDGNLLKKSTVKANSGRLSCTFDLMPHYYVDAALNNLKGEKITIIKIPDSFPLPNFCVYKNSGYAALFHIKNNQPQFLNICKNVYTTNINQIPENRIIVRTARRAMLTEAKESINKAKNGIQNIQSTRIERLALLQGTEIAGGIPPSEALQTSTDEPPAVLIERHSERNDESVLQNDIERLLTI